VEDDPSVSAAPPLPDIDPNAGFTGIIAAAWRLYRVSLAALAGLFLLVAALGIATGVAGQLAARNIESDNLRLALFLFLPTVAYVTFGSVGVAASGPLFVDRLRGGSASLGEALRAERPPLRDMLAAGLFASVIALCGVALLTPVLVLLFMPLFYGPPVVAFVVSLEKRRLQEAPSRARSLLRGSTLRVLGVLFTVALGVGIVKEMLIQASLALPRAARLAGIVATQVLADALLLPFVAAVSMVVYLGLKARDEEAPQEPAGG
jgi:hypothetical protein